MRIFPISYQQDAASYYQAISDLPRPVWLDSGIPGSSWSRVDVLAADPSQFLSYHNGALRLAGRDGGISRLAVNPLEAMRNLLAERQTAPNSELPFCGGLIGYLTYDFGVELELGYPVRSETPQLAFGLYDWAVCINHQQQKAWLVMQGQDAEGLGADELLRRLQAAQPGDVLETQLDGLPESNMSREDYGRKFQRIQSYIKEGDCYQVNFAQCFSSPFEGDAWALYQRLRRQNPAPYAAFLDWPEQAVLSLSPELFLHLQGGKVSTKPIKGTRPRGQDRARDDLLFAELAKSQKDQAENLMIVDLLRNDLGRVCVPGSIKVPSLFEIETYPSVHHLVSTIEGKLRKEQDAVSLLEACFPGGSVTGAPKHRAMQIIQELEPESRQLYCGSIGMLGFGGSMNMNVAIRTLLIRDGVAKYWAGGGIVADSAEEGEYQETLHKAAAVMPQG